MKKIWDRIKEKSIWVIIVLFIIIAFFLGFIGFMFNPIGDEPLWNQLLSIVASAMMGATVTGAVTLMLISTQSKLDGDRDIKLQEIKSNNDVELQKIRDGNAFEIQKMSKESDLQLQKYKEEKDKEFKIYESKIQVYSEFISKLWDTLKDDNLTEDELRNIRSIVFQKIIFYLSDEYITNLSELIEKIEPHDNSKTKESVQKNGKLTGELLKTFSKITILLKKDVNDSATNELNNFEEVQKLWTKFKLQPIDKCEETENKNFSYNQAWHFAMWGDEQLNAIGEDKINELSLIEYGEEWRTNLLKQIRENDIVFLFRRGGYGYIGAFRPKGWRIFEKESNREIIHEFGKKDEEVHNITEENKKKYDIYRGIKDGADLCANLIVEPLYYFPNGGTNPGGVYRRTISRYDSGYADKLMEWFQEKAKTIIK